MADDATTQQAQQVMQGAMAPPPQQPMGSNPGFFRGLLGTLLNGAYVGASVGPGPNAMQRGAQAAAQSPLTNPTVKKQQDQQRNNELQMQKMQMAQTQMNLLHTYHMMANEDRDRQDEAYETARDYYKQKDDLGKVEWMGGSTADRTTATAKADELRKQRPDDALSIQVVPMPGSSKGDKQWGVARMLKGPLDDDVSVTMKGDQASGIPNKTFTAPKGMDNYDSDSLFSHTFMGHLLGVASADKMPPEKTTPVTQYMNTPDELRNSFKQRGIQVPANIDNIWGVVNGSESMKDAFDTKDSKAGSLNKTQALDFIHKFIDGSFNPELSDRLGDYNKMLNKNETTYAEEGGKNAAQAVADANRVLEDPKAPQSLKSRATKLVASAQPVADKYHEEQVAKNTSKDSSADLKNMAFVASQTKAALDHIQKVRDQDSGKVADLANSIELLSKGGGEYTALAKIESLRGSVGGGGVRITGAELDSIGKAVGWSGSLDKFINNLTNPNQYDSLAPEQKSQLRSALGMMYRNIKAKDDAYSDAYDKLSDPSLATMAPRDAIQVIRGEQNRLNDRLRVPELSQPYRFTQKDGTVVTKMITPDKIDQAKKLGGQPVP